MKRLLILAILLTFTAFCDAGVILQPEDLEPGDRYRLLFTTSQRIDGTSTDISVYNRFVQQVADEAPVLGQWGLEWKAIVSTRAVNAADNADLRHEDHENGVPLYRVDGVLLGPNDKGFWPNAPFSGDPVLMLFGANELGEEVQPDPPDKFHVGTPVWLGTLSSGETGASPLGALRPTVGEVPFPDFWQADKRPFHEEWPVLAISEVLTAVPEPSALALVFYLPVVLWIRRDRRCMIVSRSR